VSPPSSAQPSEPRPGGETAFPVIAIDGPAGSGKSTTALGVAHALGFDYVDSGALYRAVTLVGLRKGLVEAARVDGPALAGAVERLRLEQHVRGDRNEVRLEGKDVSEALRSPEVSRLVSRVSAEPEVRRVVTEALRASARGRPVVMDGRDIGTVVFPDAALKVFLDASVEERARRRSAADRREVAAETLARRDRQDRNRTTAPLAPAPDAVLLVSDDVAREELVARIVALYRSRASSRP
jgi:cytidylate kinase